MTKELKRRIALDRLQFHGVRCSALANLAVLATFADEFVVAINLVVFAVGCPNRRAAKVTPAQRECEREQAQEDYVAFCVH